MNMKYAMRSEDTEQINVVSWANWNMNRYPELRWLFHVPNGGSRNKQEAVKFKQMGVKAGVSDLCLPYPKGSYCGLFVEMKFGNNRQQDTQKEFLADMAAAGHFVATCYSAEEAIKVIEEYLNLASMAKAAAVNNKIGYCQSHRGTFWTNLADSNFDPAQITVACEADCSSGVAAIVKGAGYRLGIDALKKVSTACYTGNLRAALKAAGFEVLTENKYLTSDAYLLAGDILLNDGAHTATNLTDGAKSSGAGASNTTPVKSNTKVDVAHGFNKSLAGTYKVTASGLNLRAGAGTGKSILAVMNHDEKVQCYGYYNDCNGVKWLYVVYKNIVGYASSKYLSK